MEIEHRWRVDIRRLVICRLLWRDVLYGGGYSEVIGLS